MKTTHKVTMAFLEFAKLKSKSAIALLVAVMMIFSSLPLTAFAAESSSNPYYNRVVDVNTMDIWKDYFDLDNLSTKNAGGVWTDKSVFKDTSAFPNSIKMSNPDENFITALSAIAANKEVVGYSTVPTDTVLILDLSNSMPSSARTQLIAATNNAIKQLQANNSNNRVGVVLYSGNNNATYNGSVTRLLPIDRYTTTNSSGNYITLSNGYVSVLSGVSGTKGSSFPRKGYEGATYMQAGLWEAYKMFDEVPDSEIVIEDNNWQSGEHRMPIVVLMSDGAPTFGDTDFANVGNANVGDGSSSGIQVGQGFLVQLTASYIKNQIENKYKVKSENGAGRSLFYTLGFNLTNISSSTARSIATSVLNPNGSTLTDSLWETYNNPSTTTMQITVENSRSRVTNVSINKNSFATSKSYVDEYFPAGSDSLTNAFNSIVEEIILQSRYYPTHLEGGSPDFSGYVEFEDTIGEYMEVKDIKGILLGDTLYDGHMMASKIANNSSDGLGTVEDPTALGDEFIRAVKTRLGIAETSQAQVLVADAYAAGQLKYNSATDWSNYIGWYAKADGTYAGFWDEKSTAAAPANAVYKIKSYGFLGETTGSIKNSDMMYMSVQVRININTGEQTLLWKIPAALVPMITYLVTLDGTNVDNAKNVKLSVENASDISPIRLVFESGLRSDLNEFNITRITDSKHIAADGVTRQFWTNYFDISADEHDDHVTTLAEFTPSKENERFYYTFDSAVFKLVGKDYVLVSQSEGLNPNGEYYHRRYIFEEGKSTPVFEYEKMSKKSIEAAVWDNDFELLTHEHAGAFVVPKGTPARELTMYNRQKSDTDNIDTKSAHMVFHPYLTEQNNLFYVDMNLGNNGLLEVTPAQGIKLSKTIDVYETGTSKEFSFRITVNNANGTPYTGTADAYVTDIDVVPTGASTKVNFSADGTYTTNLSADKTIWLSGLPTGAKYTIEEVSTNDDYRVLSVHVNGASTGTGAVGTVAAYFIDDVRFVNTAVGEGDLVIEKQVVDNNGNPVDINDNIQFTAEVTLTDNSGNPVYKTFDCSNTAGKITVPSTGKFTVELKAGEAFVIRGVPEGTKYKVVETNIPQGFKLNTAKSSLEGVVDTTANDRALIVNTYNPNPTDGKNVTVIVTKEISGNRDTWLSGESYSFKVEHIGTTGASSTVGQFTINNNDSDKKHSITLSSENYTEPGTYNYTITETKGNNKGITYDNVVRSFSVVVADVDMDGDLEITAVNNISRTTVTKSGNNYTVAASFENVYAPTDSATVEIDVVKKMDGNYRLNGFQFALYNSNPFIDEDAELFMKSTVTDTSGNAKFVITYAPNRATMEGVKYTYYMAEINPNNPNVECSEAVYKVEVTHKDNGDGTTRATSTITSVTNGEFEGGKPVFTNTFVPSKSAYVGFTANKKIDGNRALNAGEFNFVIEAITEGAPLPNNTTVSNTANGAVVFEPIEFTKAGTYKYKIYESQANKIGGFEYDTSFCEATVAVTDSDGKLYATVSRVIKHSDNESGTALGTNEIITFTNKYTADAAKVTLSGEKLFTGKKLESGEFTFVLTPDDAANPMPVDDEVENNANGKFTFDEISFSKAGVYKYSVTEKELANGKTDDRYTFDKSVYDITVTITDNSIGKLVAKVDISKNGLAATNIVFRNTFKPKPFELDIYSLFGGTKVLEGRTLTEGEFEFKLMNATTGIQIGDTVKNDAQGKFSFPAVELPEEGEYHFRISEVVGAEHGITYDTAIFHVFIKINKNDNGELSIGEQKLYKGTVTKEDVGGVLTEVVHYDELAKGVKIVFNNSYKAHATEVTLEATKHLNGRELVDGEFKFDLHKTDSTYTYNENTVIQNDVVLKLSKDGTGKISFMPLVFIAAGDYHFVIVEDEPAKDKGVTADTTVYKVKIAVTDNQKGNLVAEIYVNGTILSGAISDTVKFNNHYKAAAKDIVIEGTKKLDGRDIKDGEFSFELYDSNNKKIETVKNDKDGKFVFSAIKATEAGEYIYTIKELNDSQNNITYDETVYTVKVIVTDNKKGELVADIYVNDTIISGAISDTVKFQNYYKADATDIVIEGIKKLDGRDIKDGEFSFELYDSNNKKIETVKNDKDGKFVFSAIKATEAGEYIYSVKELNDSQDNITYDETVYVVKVIVTDNFDGTFKVEYAYTNGNNAVDGMTFVNTYTEPEPEVIPEIEDTEPSDDSIADEIPQKSPQTSDNRNYWLLLALAFVSGCSILGAVSYIRKNNAANK